MRTKGSNVMATVEFAGQFVEQDGVVGSVLKLDPGGFLVCAIALVFAQVDLAHLQFEAGANWGGGHGS